ncbi:MAG: LytTR family transcriptional regulator [Ruminococcaceae bacterium]|nr:LytTR family transcriptional regulator [Oscillospiraceae bacterium]
MKFSLIIDKSAEEEIVATVHGRSPLTDRIESLVMQFSGNDRIPVFSEDEMKLLPFSETECIIVSEGKTFAIDSAGKKFRIKMRLYEIEEILPSYFIRINKSAIANEKRLERFSVGFSGAVDAVFKSGYKEYVSRRCFAEIKRRYSAK